MKALKFTLSGKTAFFKIPEVNSYMYFTYSNIHRVSLLGMIGGIVGLKGYSDDKREKVPEFYDKLSNLKISVLPNNEKGYFQRKKQTFNNSVGYASKEEGGNLIINQVWLENVSWDIFIILDNEESLKVSEMILNNKAVYIPYLGSNDHIADINNQEIVEIKKGDETQINSLFWNEDIKIDRINPKSFRYTEYLPFYLEENTERHIRKETTFTNASTKIINENIQVFNYAGRNMVFYSEDGAY